MQQQDDSGLIVYNLLRLVYNEKHGGGYLNGCSRVRKGAGRNVCVRGGWGVVCGWVCVCVYGSGKRSFFILIELINKNNTFHSAF